MGGDDQGEGRRAHEHAALAKGHLPNAYSILFAPKVSVAIRIKVKFREGGRKGTAYHGVVRGEIFNSKKICLQQIQVGADSVKKLLSVGRFL